MSKGFLITISGIDGSGKSSNTVALQRSLESIGVPATRAWVGHKPILSFPFLAFVRLLGYTHRKEVKGITFYWRDIGNNAALAKLWPLVLALDFFPKAILSVTIPHLKGRTVVCDRYLYDMIAELSQQRLIGPRTKKILSGMLPRPNISFLMDVDENLAWKRALVPGRAREQPIYDLGERRKAFLQLAREFHMIILDGGGDLEHNRAEILNLTLGSRASSENRELRK